jgi:hypothetical protein
MTGYTARQIIFFMGGWISDLLVFYEAILASPSKGGEKPSLGSDERKKKVLR